jgi:hypothetical protein
MVERPVYSNYQRDLPSAIVRVTVFVIPLAREIIEGREPEEATVAGCEGDACILPTRAGDNG